ncbi:hypothetical protein QQ045_013459 [Rhodiola kirilowii]
MIQGEVLAVKRAMVAISGCLQSYVDSVEKDDVMESRFLDSHLELLPERHVIQPRGSLMRVPISRSPLNHILDGRLSPTNTSRLDVCLGRGGSIITALQTETGATISIGPQVDDCADRLFTVKATEVCLVTASFVPFSSIGPQVDDCADSDDDFVAATSQTKLKSTDC